MHQKFMSLEETEEALRGYKVGQGHDTQSKKMEPQEIQRQGVEHEEKGKGIQEMEPPPQPNLETEFTQSDARKLWSSICHEEEGRNKKRRWLMGSTTLQGAQKRLKTPKFLRNVSLQESFLRSDDVFFETIRTSVERNFRSHMGDQERHHVVQDYLHLFDLRHGIHPVNVLKTLSAALNYLNSGALCLVANIVTENKVRFERTRPMMKAVILENLPDKLTEWNCKDDNEPIKQLSQIFREPSNFRENNMQILTPVSSSLLSSINKALERLNDMPSGALIAMKRRLKDVSVVPQFPPINFSSKRVFLIKQVRRKCEMIVRGLMPGDDLSKPFANALSVVCLSLKQTTGREVIPTSEFFPFPPEVEALQNNILKAIWSLPNLKNDELKAVQLLLDPKAVINRRNFRKAILQYLVEYLFECQEIDVSKPFLSILDFINRRSQQQSHSSTKELIEEEMGVVLNVSCQLRQVLWDTFPDHSIDEEFADAYGSCGDSDFVIFDDYLSALGESGHLQTYASDDDKPEGIGETADSSPIRTSDFRSSQFLEENQIKECKSEGKPKHEPTACLNGLELCPRVSKQSNAQSSLLETKNIAGNQYLAIQNVCDETSLLAHGLIGRLVEELSRVEGMDKDDAVCRSSRRGGPSPTTDLQDVGKVTNSLENTEDRIIIRVVEELLPSGPKSGVEKLKELLGVL